MPSRGMIGVCFLIVTLGIIITLSGGCSDPNMSCTPETELKSAKVIGHSEEERAGRDSSNTCQRTLKVTILQWVDTGETFIKCHHIGKIGDSMLFPRSDKNCVPINVVPPNDSTEREYK